MSIFDSFGKKKEILINTIQKAESEGILDVKETANLTQEIDEENLVIGVVGQIKNGKSTLLNTMLFGKQILPTATTPMTAALSYIQYGESYKIEVEFITQQELDELEKLSKVDSTEKTIKIAKDMWQQVVPILDEIKDILGTRKTISQEEIHEYVGESGKYVPITKALYIFYPAERLRGVAIVDTPGVNDPIASRSQRSEDFLQNADVVLVLFSAERPFDAVDSELVFSKIRKVRCGRVLILVNKYDAILDEENTEEKVMHYIQKEFQKQIDKIQQEEPEVVDIYRSTEPIMCSSLIGLLGKIDEADRDENLNWYYDNFKDKFPLRLKTQEDFITFSRLPIVEEAISTVIQKEKWDLLVKKPFRTIHTKLTERLADIKRKQNALDTEKNRLHRSMQELKQEEKQLRNMENDLKETIPAKLYEIKVEMLQEMEKSKTGINEAWDKLVEDIEKKIPEKGFLQFSWFYVQDCKRMIEKEIHTFQKKVFESDSFFYSTFRNIVVERFNLLVDALKSDIDAMASKNKILTIDEVNNYKEDVLGFFDSQPMGELHVNLKETGFFLWWGASKRDVIHQTLDQLNSLERKKAHIKPFEDLSQEALSYLEKIKNNFVDKFQLHFMEPIKNAQQNLDHSETRLQSIEQEENELAQEKEQMESLVSSYEYILQIFSI